MDNEVEISTPDHFVEGKFEDRGDLKIMVDGVAGRIEVKQTKKFYFHSPESWPLSQIFIDTAFHVYDKEYPLPLCAYAIVNRDITGMFWIPAYYKDHWITTRTDNSLTQYNHRVVAMDKFFLKGLYFAFDGDQEFGSSLVSLEQTLL